MKIKQIYCFSQTTCFTIPLEPRKIIKKSLMDRMIILYVLFIAVGISWLVQSTGGIPGLPIYDIFLGIFIVIFLLFIVGVIYQIFYFRYYFYDLTPEEIIIMKGVVARNKISIRYEKVQNIFIDQDFLDRIFRLYDVHVATADPQSAMVAHIDGVSRENAEKLKSILDEKIRSRHGESGV